LARLNEKRAVEALPAVFCARLLFNRVDRAAAFGHCGFSLRRSGRCGVGCATVFGAAVFGAVFVARCDCSGRCGVGCATVFGAVFVAALRRELASRRSLGRVDVSRVTSFGSRTRSDEQIRHFQIRNRGHVDASVSTL